MGDHLKTDQHKVDATPEELDEMIEARQAFLDWRDRRKKKVSIVKQSDLQKIRIECVAFLLQNGLPFSVSSNLVSFFQHLLNLYNTETLKSVEISNVTAAQIAKNCISKSYKDEIYRDISRVPFSLQFDESASKSGPSYLCTFVRYIKNDVFQDRLLGLNEITEGSTGLELYKLVMNEVFGGEKKMLL